MRYGLPIDIDAVQCVDLGHHWNEVFFGRADTGQLKGLPIRLSTCATCRSERLDHLTWDGHVTSRQYFPAEAYITNARALGDHFERRAHLRAAKARRLQKEGNRGEGSREDPSQRSA